MDWNINLRNLVSRPAGLDASPNFLFNYNYDHFPGMQLKHPTTMVDSFSGMEKMGYGCNQERKKKLTTDQLDSLEKSFQEEIKLDPERKVKLSRELGLQPRQIAVWFQNRRARWKGKQLERLYDALKEEFDAINKEKHRLQDEVLKLRSMLKEEATKKPLSAGGTDASGDETVESTSVMLRSSSKPRAGNYHLYPVSDTSYVLGGDEYNTVPSPFWPLPLLPAYPS